MSKLTGETPAASADPLMRSGAVQINAGLRDTGFASAVLDFAKQNNTGKARGTRTFSLDKALVSFCRGSIRILRTCEAGVFDSIAAFGNSVADS